MRWNLLAVYLLLQVAVGLLALHFLLPLLATTPESQEGEPRTLDYPTGALGMTVAVGAISLFLLAPWSVLEYAGVLRHRPIVPMVAWVVGVALILAAALVVWTDETTARFSVITASAGIVALIAAKHWPDETASHQASPPPRTAPAEPSEPLPPVFQ